MPCAFTSAFYSPCKTTHLLLLFCLKTTRMLLFGVAGVNMTRNIAGNVPEPDELYGRDRLISHLWRQLQGNNILLLAPRRFGKTGVMNHVLERPQERFLPLYFDLEDVDAPAEFVWRITNEVLSQSTLRQCLHGIRGFPEQIGSWFKDTFDDISFQGAKVSFKESIATSWQETAQRLLRELERAEPTLIFIFDEFPSMLSEIAKQQGDDEAREFMAWFRTVRMQRRDMLRRHRFILGGSTGIDVILRRLATPDKLNDFERLYVEPISLESGHQLSRDLAASMNLELTDDLIQHIFGLIGPIVPYFIHLLFSQLGQLPPAQQRPLSTKTVDDIYQTRILGPTCKSYFDHYRSRLARYDKPIERAAIAMLTAVARSGRISASALYDVYQEARKTVGNDIEFNELVADLECDWYLTLDPTTNEYHFMLDIMRDWWQRWYRTPMQARR